jgi:hypothetical protein
MLLPFSEFHVEKTGYIRTNCYSCRLEHTRQVRSMRQQLPKQIPITKYCIKCNKSKSASEFNKLSLSVDGLDRLCRECYKIHRHKRVTHTPDVNNILTCIACKQTKSTTEFRPTKKSLTGYFKKCNACQPKSTWTAEKQKASEKKYVANNKDKLREKWRNAYTNPNRIIRDRLNHRISSALKSAKTRKDNTTSTYIGCSIPFLRKWLEYQFTNTLGWHNYGEWHIDHVIPCSLFDLSNPAKQVDCFNWRNLRPCMGIENISKGGKYLPELVEHHKQLVSKFLESTPLPT